VTVSLKIPLNLYYHTACMHTQYALTLKVNSCLIKLINFLVQHTCVREPPTFEKLYEKRAEFNQINANDNFMHSFLLKLRTGPLWTFYLYEYYSPILNSSSYNTCIRVHIYPDDLVIYHASLSASKQTLWNNDVGIWHLVWLLSLNVAARQEIVHHNLPDNYYKLSDCCWLESLIAHNLVNDSLQAAAVKKEFLFWTTKLMLSAKVIM